MNTNLKLFLIALISFLLGFFICQKYFCKNLPADNEVPPIYDSVNVLFNKYSKQISKPTSNFAGLEFSSKLLIDVASVLDSTTKVQMLLGVDSNRSKVVYFKELIAGTTESRKPELIYYISENKLLKFSVINESFFAFNNGNQRSTSSLKVLFENVFASATAAARPPTCPPWDPRCKTVQAAKVEGINTSETLTESISSSK